MVDKDDNGKFRHVFQFHSQFVEFYKNYIYKCMLFFCTIAVTTSAFSYEIVVSRLYFISFDTKSRPTGNSEIKIECLKKT